MCLLKISKYAKNTAGALATIAESTYFSGKHRKDAVVCLTKGKMQNITEASDAIEYLYINEKKSDKITDMTVWDPLVYFIIPLLTSLVGAALMATNPILSAVVYTVALFSILAYKWHREGSKSQQFTTLFERQCLLKPAPATVKMLEVATEES